MQIVFFSEELLWDQPVILYGKLCDYNIIQIIFSRITYNYWVYR